MPSNNNKLIYVIVITLGVLTNMMINDQYYDFQKNHFGMTFTAIRNGCTSWRNVHVKVWRENFFA